MGNKKTQPRPRLVYRSVLFSLYFPTYRLGLCGVIKGFDIDTNHFTGNYAVEAMVEGVCIDEEISVGKWTISC